MQDQNEFPFKFTKNDLKLTGWIMLALLFLVFFPVSLMLLFVGFVVWEIAKWAWKELEGKSNDNL